MVETWLGCDEERRTENSALSLAARNCWSDRCLSFAQGLRDSWVTGVNTMSSSGAFVHKMVVS